MKDTLKKAGAPLAIVAAVVAAFFGCSCESPRASYVRADRDTFEAVAPAHRRYVEADDSLDEGQKQARFDMLRTWEIRIETEEEVLNNGR